MRQLGSILGFGMLLAALLAFVPSEVIAEKKKDAKAEKDKSKYPPATDVEYKAIQKQKELVGKLVKVDTGSVSVRVEYPHYEANPKYKAPKSGDAAQQQLWKSYNDLQIQMQKAAFAKTPREAMQAQQRIAQDMARLQQQIAKANSGNPMGKVDPNNQPFILVTSTKDFDLELQEKVVVRKLILPFEYDDVGAVKTYTEKEKADLRGDDKTKPGYMAKIEEFKAGQEVKLYLTPPMKKEKAKDADKDKEKEADKAKEKDAKTPEMVARPTVNMIVLTKDGDSSGTISSGDTKKKKKN